MQNKRTSLLFRFIWGSIGKRFFALQKDIDTWMTRMSTDLFFVPKNAEIFKRDPSYAAPAAFIRDYPFIRVIRVPILEEDFFYSADLPFH